MATGNTPDEEEEDAINIVLSPMGFWATGEGGERIDANSSNSLDGDEEAASFSDWTSPFSCQWANSFIVRRNIIIRLDRDLCNDRTICILTFLPVCFTSTTRFIRGHCSSAGLKWSIVVLINRGDNYNRQ